MHRGMKVMLCIAGMFVCSLLSREMPSSIDNGTSWRVFTESQKTMYVAGYLDGYHSAADLAAIRSKGNPQQRALAEKLHEAMYGGKLRNGQIVTAVDAFYGDFRNMPVCWPIAVIESVRALKGETPTEQEMQMFRQNSAKSGC